MARIEAIVRRRDPRAAEQTELKTEDLRSTSSDARLSVASGDRTPPREFAILEYMMRKPDGQ